MLHRSCMGVLFVGALLGVAAPASADLLPPGKTYVPLSLTLDGQAAFGDTTFVVLGCSSAEGRHQVAFAKPAEALVCKTKAPPTVHAVAAKDLKPLQDLVAKDLGWAAEGIEARKLVEKAPSCGAIDEKTLVESTRNVTMLAARYAIEKTTTGCSLKKVGETVTQTSSPASAAATASAAPSAAAAPATPASPPAKSSGCSASTRARSDGGLFAGLGLALLASIGFARRRLSEAGSRRR
jgi:hypothetical protein